jgi:LAS superfamily LD-carboxypeptidase LdcB
VTPRELTGRARSHLCAAAATAPLLHRHVARPFAELVRAARGDGLEVSAVSTFRDFERQLAIWNAKWLGQMPLLDAAGAAVDSGRLEPAERIEAILCWSALPGASRHHWGSDLDVIDSAALPPGHRVSLTRAEFAAGGPFARLDAWLERHAARFGFFRPYRGIRSGVQPEPWHLSFAPVAEPARRQLSLSLLREALEATPLAGREHVFARLADLHARYVACIDGP